MRKFNEENERIKRAYRSFLREAEGYDEASLDKVAAALLSFEEALGFRPFKEFHRDWAERYKKALSKRKNAKTGKTLGMATRDGMLRHVRGFILWLSSQTGYKSRVTPADVRYFNNNRKDARAAHALRPASYPSLQQCAHAFRMMPQTTELERRDRALFALAMMTAARANALASLRLCHANLIDGLIFQDGREVRTKAAKTFETWFMPVDPMYRAAFEDWVIYLGETRLYGPSDAVFPKQHVAQTGGAFRTAGLSREPYANAQPVTDIIKRAFTTSGQPPYTPHAFRKTLAMHGDALCNTLEENKAWSQNLGHDHLATTISAYMPVPRERQAEIIRCLGRE